MKTTLESSGTTIGWPVDFMTDLHKRLGEFTNEAYTEMGLFKLQTRLQALVEQHVNWKLLDQPQVERVNRSTDAVIADETAFNFDEDKPSWFRLTDVNRREFFVKVTA